MQGRLDSLDHLFSTALVSKALGLGLMCPEDCGRDNPLTGQRDVRPCNNRKEAEERVAGSRVAGGNPHPGTGAGGRERRGARCPRTQLRQDGSECGTREMIKTA